MKANLTCIILLLFRFSLVGQNDFFPDTSIKTSYVHLTTDSVKEFYHKGKIYNLFKERMTTNDRDVVFPKNDTLLDGDWIVLYENSEQPYTTASFIKGVENGISYVYDVEGNLRMEMPYLQGKLNGTHYVYNKKGDVIWERDFVNGYTHGHIIRYYENGYPKEEFFYANGREIGYRKWNEKGKLIEEKKDYEIRSGFNLKN